MSFYFMHWRFGIGADAPRTQGVGISRFFGLFLFLFCLSGLFFIPRASAHDTYDSVTRDGSRHDGTRNNITAMDAASDRESNLENFVRHASSHLAGARNFREALSVLDNFRKEGGDWLSGSTYLILLTKGGGVYVHAKQRELEDQNWSESLLGCSGESWSSLVEKGGGCVMYSGHPVNEPKGYAVAFSAPHVPFARPHNTEEKGFVLVGGLDYRPEPVPYASFDELVEDMIDDFIRNAEVDSGIDFSILPDDEKERIEQTRKSLRENLFEPSINARDITGLHDLKGFLKEATSFVTHSFSSELSDPVVLRRILRFEGGPWRHLSSYIYIMDHTGRVVFNGANRNIEQTDLWDFRSENGQKVIQDILKASEKPEGGSIEYYWDDPNVTGDEPHPPGAGGESYKLGYAIRFPIDENRVYVFGTGLYVPNEEKEARDGCSIAETDVSSLAMNLLAIAFLLFLTASLKNSIANFFRQRGS